MANLRTTDRYGRLIGGSVVTCPRCSATGFVSFGPLDEDEAECGLCPRYVGLLSLPLAPEVWAVLHEEEALSLGLEDYESEAEAVKTAWLRGDLIPEAA